MRERLGAEVMYTKFCLCPSWDLFLLSILSLSLLSFSLSSWLSSWRKRKREWKRNTDQQKEEPCTFITWLHSLSSSLWKGERMNEERKRMKEKKAIEEGEWKRMMMRSGWRKRMKEHSLSSSFSSFHSLFPFSFYLSWSIVSSFATPFHLPILSFDQNLLSFLSLSLSFFLTRNVLSFFNFFHLPLLIITL